MGRRVKVLIADDEVLVRIGIIHVIDWEGNGFEIVGEAVDGESCMKLARRLRPDLIVLDINMPGMNGLEVLHRLKEEDFGGKVIMLTCYDEFEYACEALRGGASDYVLKSGMKESGLLEAVLRLDYGAGDWTESQMAEGNLKTEQLLRQKLAGYSFGEKGEFSFHASCFCCMAGRILNMAEIEKRYAQRGMELFYRSLYSILEQSLQGYQEYNALLYDRETLGIFISFSDTVSTQELLLLIRRLAGRIHSTMQSYLDLDLELGVSGFCYGEEEIRRAWEQAVLMLGRGFTEKGRIFYFNDFRDAYGKQSRILEELAETEISLKKCVMDGQTEQLREGLQAYFEQIRRGRIISAERVRGFLMDLVKLIQARKSDWSGEKILEQIWEQETLEETETCVYAWLDRIFPDKGDQNANWLVQRACEYIREHYREDVSLARIAGYLQLSESYTSRIFNREMGMNIPACVNLVRLERAKELLLHTNQKIYEIAQEVGYLSTTAFHVAFKKQEGITPIEYRNQKGNKF